MSIFSELRRRNVFRVSIAYLIGGWLVIQVADIVLENIGAPAWVMQAILLLLVLGLVGAVFFSWAFEVTPEGLKRESEVDRTKSITSMTGRKLDRSITVMLVVALGYFIWESRIADRSPETETVATVVAEEVSTTFDKSIAVLPFDNRSSRKEDEYFTDGIHDDLLTTIAKIGSMRVISRTSVMEYKDTTKNLRDIARELGVANILEGGIQRSGNQVRINVQLIDAATDEHLWAEIYDRELTAENIFGIQSEISKAIAEALQVALSLEDQQKIETVHTQSLEAYESYLLGRRLWTERSAESNAASVEHFQHAIDIDPAYALAYVGLSDAYRFKVNYEGELPDDVNPLAERAARTALQINPNLGEAYASLGALKSVAGDSEGAERDFRRALELNPNHSDTYNWYANALANDGRAEEGLSLLQKGLQVDPLSIVMRNNVGVWQMQFGRMVEARKTFKRNIEMHPDASIPYLGKGIFQITVDGRLDDGALSWSKALVIEPTDASTMVFLAMLYMNLGDLDTALGWLDRSLILQPDSGDQALGRMLYAMHNDQQVEAAESAQEVYAVVLQTTYQTQFLALEILRDRDIAAGRPEDAMARYATVYPEIVDHDVPDLHVGNFFCGRRNRLSEFSRRRRGAGRAFAKGGNSDRRVRANTRSIWKRLG